MRPMDLIQETQESLSAKKGRSILTVLGIVIGIMSVVVMVSVISGVSSWLEDNMGLGSARVVTVTSSDSQHELEYDDAAFLEEADLGVDTVLPEATTSFTVDESSSSESSSDSSDTSSASSTSSSGTSLQVVGVASNYFDLQSVELSSGSLYDDENAFEIVLDESAVENIYGENASVVGQTITLGGDAYKIVGVAESASGLMSGMSSSIGYVSYETMTTTILGTKQVDTLLAMAGENEDVSRVAAKIEGALAARHNVEYDDDGEQDAFSATTTESALESLESFTVAFDALAALVAGIALLVGGIGIMNMMLTNVSERYREIGLRKSLGARPGDITLQFLAESVALCLTGGVAGIILGYAGAWGLVALLGRINSTFSGLVPVVSPLLVLVVFLVCFCIGVIFGYYPARRAAKLNPAETLRYQ